MAWAEALELRTARAKHLVDQADPRRRRAVLTLHDQHYRDSLGGWQEAAEELVAEGGGFDWQGHRGRHLVRLGEDGRRRWHPRRNVVDEYVELGRPEFWNGIGWSTVPLGVPTRQGGELVWDRPAYALRVGYTWRRLKLDLVLKGPTAARRFRWPAGLVGLDRQGRRLLSARSGAVVGSLAPLVAWDAEGRELPLAVRLAGGAVELEIDPSGAVYPLTIDPTYDSQPDATAGVDTSTDEGNPNSTTRGTSTELLHEADAGTRGIALVRFDTSSISGWTALTGRTLYLWTARSRSAGSDRVMEVHRGLSPISGWGERSNWNFLNFDDSTRWPSDVGNDGGSDAGGSVAGTDYSNTVMGSFTIAVSQAAGTQHTIGLDNAETEALLGANYGFVIVATVNGLDVATRSSDSATASERPRLVIDYTTDGGSPTPRLLASLGVGT